MNRERPSPEFFNLIYDWDPNATDDEYYATSEEFLELHSRIKDFLIQRLMWWTASVATAVVGLSIIFG